MAVMLELSPTDDQRRARALPSSAGAARPEFVRAAVLRLLARDASVLERLSDD